MDSPPARREIDLHRRVCVVKPDSIEIKPARSAAIAPLIGLLLAVFAFVAVVPLVPLVAGDATSSRSPTTEIRRAASVSICRRNRPGSSESTERERSSE